MATPPAGLVKAECDQYRSASLPQSRLPSPIPHIGALSVAEIDRPLVRPKAWLHPRTRWSAARPPAARAPRAATRPPRRVQRELSAKRLEVLKDTFPGLRKIAMLWNANDLGMTWRYKNAEAAARTLGFEIQPLGVREPEDFAAAFAAMVRDRPDAILMVTDALTGLNRKRVFEFAAEHKLPAIYEYDFLVRDGGLMSYGPDMSEVDDRAADLADRILKGARPADLPFEQPTRFRLVINKKTLETLGLTIPAAMLMRADEVID